MQLELAQILGGNITVAINEKGNYAVTAIDWQKLTTDLHDLFVGWKSFKDESPPLYKTICMCYKDGRIDGGVFNGKDEVDMWRRDYNPIAWMVLNLPTFLNPNHP